MRRLPDAGTSLVTLVVIGLSVFLFTYRLGETPLIDPDEGRYAVGAAGMLATGDWVVPRLNGAPRLNKPPLVYWLQAVAMKLGGRGEAAARMPSAIAGLVVVLSLILAGGRRGETTAGLLAGLVVATTALSFGGFHLCVPDAVMSALLTVALLLALAVHEGRLALWPGSLLTGAVLGLAVLAKGHVPLLVFLAVELGYLLLRGRRSRLAPAPLLAGAALALLPSSPWILGVVQRIGWDPLLATVTGEVARVRVGAEHPEPWHYYLLRYPLVLLPWTGFFLEAVVAGWRERRGSDLMALSLSWSLAPLLIFSLSAGKHILYLLPAVPGVALLTGMAWTGRHSAGGMTTRGRLLAVAGLTSLFVAVGTAFLDLHHSSRRFFAEHAVLSVALSVGLTLLLLLLAWWRRAKLLIGLTTLFMAGVMATGLFLAPETVGMSRSTRLLAQAYLDLARPGDEVVFYRSSAERHASFLFYTGRPVTTCWRSRELRQERHRPGTLFMICGVDDHARLREWEGSRWEGPLARTRELALYRERTRNPRLEPLIPLSQGAPGDQPRGAEPPGRENTPGEGRTSPLSSDAPGQEGPRTFR